MTNFNPEIHHRQSTRLGGYDYSHPGFYFVTICLNDVRCMLATTTVGVRHGEPLRQSNPPHSPQSCNTRSLQLTPIGKIANQYWLEIPRHYPTVVLDEFVIMPDHVHGILQLRDGDRDFFPPNPGGFPVVGVRHGEPLPNQTDSIHCHGEPLPNQTDSIHCHGEPLPNQTDSIHCHDKPPQKFCPTRQNEYQHIIRQSIGIIVNHFKSAVTRWTRQNGFPQFQWQRSFHDLIIRDDNELFKIRQYIRNNPRQMV